MQTTTNLQVFLITLKRRVLLWKEIVLTTIDCFNYIFFPFHVPIYINLPSKINKSNKQTDKTNHFTFSFTLCQRNCFYWKKNSKFQWHAHSLGLIRHSLTVTKNSGKMCVKKTKTKQRAWSSWFFRLCVSYIPIEHPSDV